MCPYCANTGFVGDAAYCPDQQDPNVKPDAYRWLNKCSTCAKWSVCLPGGEQTTIPDPDDPESLE